MATDAWHGSLALAPHGSSIIPIWCIGSMGNNALIKQVCFSTARKGLWSSKCSNGEVMMARKNLAFRHFILWNFCLHLWMPPFHSHNFPGCLEATSIYPSPDLYFLILGGTFQTYTIYIYLNCITTNCISVIPVERIYMLLVDQACAYENQHQYSKSNIVLKDGICKFLLDGVITQQVKVSI